jgi:hypothetical protein
VSVINLIGKKYPVIDIDTNIKSYYRKITSCYELSNVAGFVIGLSGKDPSIFISVKTAVDLMAGMDQEIENELV